MKLSMHPCKKTVDLWLEKRKEKQTQNIESLIVTFELIYGGEVMVSSKRMIISWLYVWFYTFFSNQSLIRLSTFATALAWVWDIWHLASFLLFNVSTVRSRATNKGIFLLPCLQNVLLKLTSYHIPNISIGIKGGRGHLASFLLFNVSTVPLRATGKNIDRNSSASAFPLYTSEASSLSNCKYQHWHRG